MGRKAKSIHGTCFRRRSLTYREHAFARSTQCMSLAKLTTSKVERGAACAHRTSGEEFLHHGDQGVAATYENAGIGIAEVDADGKLRRVNAWLARLLGRPAEELLGRSIFDPELTYDTDADFALFRRQV